MQVVWSQQRDWSQRKARRFTFNLWLEPLIPHELHDPYKAEGQIPVVAPAAYKFLSGKKREVVPFFLVEMSWLVRKVCLWTSDEFWYWGLLYVYVSSLWTEKVPVEYESPLPWTSFAPCWCKTLWKMEEVFLACGMKVEIDILYSLYSLTQLGEAKNRNS